MYSRNQLVQLIRDKALSIGNFKLASGQISPYYIDLSKVVMSCEGLSQIVDGFSWLTHADGVYWDDFDSIGGPAMGAIPLVSAMMLETGIERSFFVRKETKEYGLNDLIEGNLKKGDRVLMLEDVTTSGGSLYKAIQAVENVGAKVTRIYSVLDREAGARAFFQEKGYNFNSLLSISQILADGYGQTPVKD